MTYYHGNHSIATATTLVYCLDGIENLLWHRSTIQIILNFVSKHV